MRKFTAILLVASMLLSLLAGCGQPNAATTAPSTSHAPETTVPETTIASTTQTPTTAAPTTAQPTTVPSTTAAPTDAPTAAPTAAPTDAPTEAPTAAPTAAPTDAPTAAPTAAPTQTPTECNHKYKVEEQVEASCSAAGYTVYKCANCGHNYETEIPKLSHEFVDATCTKPKTCSACGITEGEALGHEYVDGKCIRCAEESPDSLQNKYCYNTYTTKLGTNWNPHTWQTTGDSQIMNYLVTPLVDISIEDSTMSVYQWIFVAAEDIQDVTAEHKKDLAKYGCAETDANIGYIYEIKLRPEMKWQDGTPINADTYIYSMKALLDPAMKNDRASDFCSYGFGIAGAEEYFYQESAAIRDNSATGAITDISELKKGKDGVYTLADGAKVWIAASAAIEWLGGNSLADYAGAYGNMYFDTDSFEKLNAKADKNGLVPVTDKNLDLLTKVITYTDIWGESAANIVNYFMYEEKFGKWSFDQVGLYKVDDYTIRYVCETQCDYYAFLDFCKSNWLVHEELYEKCKVGSGELTASIYGTSVDTTMSYGPYKLESVNGGKQAVFVQNENYWEYTRNPNGTLSSKTFFKVDGEYQPQYMTQKIIIDVMTEDAARQAFMNGLLDEWKPAIDEVLQFSTSDRLYRADESYTMRLFFNNNLDALKKMDQEGNQNSVVLSNDKFRKAMSLALDRSDFVAATAGYKPAFTLINSSYFYDVYNDPASIYRNSEEAMQAICNIYGVQYGPGTPYADVKAAYDSITGFNLNEARALMTEACQELVEAGLYKEGEKIVIQLAWSSLVNSPADWRQIELLNEYLNTAMKDTGFGTIELQGNDEMADRFQDVPAGLCAIGWGAWGGAPFQVFTMFTVFCDPDYTAIHEAGCWDPIEETLTLTIDGEEVTMTWQDWSNSMVGLGKYATASNETKLQVLAGIEENYMQLYYCIPVCSVTDCSMLSYKVSYYTENHNIMYGFGGLRLLKYHYTDAEWKAFVGSQGGTLEYT